MMCLPWTPHDKMKLLLPDVKAAQTSKANSKGRANERTTVNSEVVPVAPALFNLPL
jgi:hypothetical protein